MPKPSSSKPTAKSPKSKANSPAKARARVSSKSVPSGFFARWQFSFLGLMVVAAAVLIAVAIGFSSYKQSSSVTVASDQAALYVRADKSDFKPGSTVSLDVYESSGSQPVNTVQSDIVYPADKLNLTSVTTSEDFPQEAATNTTTPGLVRIARSIDSQLQSVEGTKLVATINFTVKSEAKGKVVFGIKPQTSLVVRSSDNQNILKVTPTSSYDIK